MSHHPIHRTIMNPSARHITTNVEASDAHTADPNKRLLILPNCNADVRCEHWLGALNGEQKTGCGINVLRFMSEMSEEDAQRGLQEAMASGQGTPFSIVVNWFNYKYQHTGKNQNINPFKRSLHQYVIAEEVIDISSIEALTRYFNILLSQLPPNACTIVKLNRHPDPRQRPGNLTPGHYVLMSKDAAGVLSTYEPYLSTRGNCDKRPYKGSVSPEFFREYSSQGYLNVSLLIVVGNRTLMRGGRKQGNNQRGGYHNVMPAGTMDALTRDIERSIECNNTSSGRKTKRTKRNRSSRISRISKNKNKTTRRKSR